VSEDARRTEPRPETFSEALAALMGNTLRKTGPQLLLAVWFWGLVLGRHDLNSQSPNHPTLIVAFVAGFAFTWIVFRRVLGALPHQPLPILFFCFNGLFIGYGLWLGFGPPVHRRDVREWLGWIAMGVGLAACLILVVPAQF